MPLNAFASALLGKATVLEFPTQAPVWRGSGQGKLSLAKLKAQLWVFFREDEDQGRTRCWSSSAQRCSCYPEKAVPDGTKRQALR